MVCFSDFYGAGRDVLDSPGRSVSALSVWQNIVFALGVKVAFIGLGIIGVTTMWEAVFADVGVAIIALFNAMRILK